MLTPGYNGFDRRKHFDDNGDIGYEKRHDDSFVWTWDWSNELESGFFMPSQEVAFYRVYDVSALKYRDIIRDSWQAFTEMAAWPSTTQATDALYFGNLHWPDEAEFAIETPTTVAVYAGDAAAWEYYNGTAWVALTLLRDGTDSTAFDGLRPFQQAGTITFNKPTDMASISIDGISAEWIRVRPTTPGNITTVAIFSYADVSEFVSTVAYVDDGVTHTQEQLDGNISAALISGTGEMEATMTSSVGRVVQKTFRFYAPQRKCESDYD